MATKKLKVDKKTVSKLSQEDLRNINGGKTTVIRPTDFCNQSEYYCATKLTVISPVLD